jgi:curved DNA-binding protein CbpA
MDIFDNDKTSYYDILEIKHDATQAEIRQAYFRAKAAYSKDSQAFYSIFEDQETKLILEKIEQAYLVLSNVEKRREYDRVHGFLSFDNNQVKTNDFDFFTTHAPKTTHHESVESAAKTVFGAGSDTNFSFFEDDENLNENKFNENINTKAFESKTSQSRFFESPFQSKAFSNNEKTLLKTNNTSTSQTNILVTNTKDDEVNLLIQNETEFHGSFFAKIRELKNLSLDQISQITKIKVPYLLALENEDFSALPATAYVRGFVQQYAKLLKLPVEKATQKYIERLQSSRIK